MVVRGLCWEWEDQDGGEGQIGQVTEVQEFHSKYRRNVARVQWMGNGASNVYRIGHNGKVSNAFWVSKTSHSTLSKTFAIDHLISNRNSLYVQNSTTGVLVLRMYHT